MPYENERTCQQDSLPVQRVHESNIGSWKVGAVQEAIKIAEDLGFKAWESTHQPTTKGGNAWPTLVINMGTATSLSEFWTKLTEAVPNYWKADEES